MPLTTDPNDERLGHGGDVTVTDQNDVYLVLSEEERAKGFVRPLRLSYRHAGPQGPKNPLRDLTDEQKERFGDDWAKFEVYPESESPKTGKFWTQAQLDTIGNGCQTVTTMATGIAETYARNPGFYGFTFCVHCQKHLPVSEFVWTDDGSRVGS
jgi:hypothetical protein